MSIPPVEHDRRTEILAEVVILAAAKVASAQRAEIGDFVHRYYGQVDSEDLAERTPADLCGAALSQWEFARQRDAGRAKVRVFNPVRGEQDWQSTHTIVEIDNDDMPFLVDSVTMEVNRRGLTQHLIIHPIVAVERDAEGTLVRLVADGSGAGRAESFIHVEVDRITDAGEREALAADLLRVLAEVRAAVDDWSKMTEKALAIAADVERTAPPLPPGEVTEGVAFLRWLADNHFTFLGHRSYDLDQVDGKDMLRIVPGSSLGILRDRPGKEVASQLFSAAA